MANESEITLYDSATRDGKSPNWNPLVLKIRYALKLKKLPYKTIFLEYPDFESTLRGIAASPTGNQPDGSPMYTLPTIIDPSRRAASGGPMIVSNSWNIAQYLEAEYPDHPSLFPYGTKALQRLFHDRFWNAIFMPIARILVPTIHDYFLNDASRPYWRETREAWFGEKMEYMCPKGTQKCEERWSIVQEGFTEIAKPLDENGANAGALVMESQVSYGDFTVVAILQAVFVLMPEEWERRVKK